MLDLILDYWDAIPDPVGFHEREFLRNAFAVVGMVLFGALGGAFVPYDVLPGWAKDIAPAMKSAFSRPGAKLIEVVVDGTV